MAEVIRYVNTDSAGGDGTTNGVSGATAAYATLSAWEAAEQVDLVSAGNWMHVYCSAPSGTADTTALTIVGWTTGAANYILIEAADGDEAVKTSYDTARYRLEVTDDNPITINEDYVRVKGLQMKIIYSSVNYKYGFYVNSIGASNDIRLYNNRIVVDGAFNGGIVVIDSDANVQIWNTIITGDGAGQGRTGVVVDNGTVDIYNCIIYGIDYVTTLGGIRQNGGTVTATNCAVFSNRDDFNGTITIDYCASDDGDGTNAVAPSGSDWDNEYTNPATGDFTLLNGGNCFEGGADNPSSGVYTTDMEGDAYNVGGYSIGVDEYVAAGGLSIPVAMYYYRSQQ